MFPRKLLTGIVAGGLAASVIGLSAGAASAATDPDDTTGTPIAANLIGVGSDTSQNAIFRVAQAYNATTPVASIFTYAATGGGTIALPAGAINRPVGSGAGKNLLYGSTNNIDIDFARSSSAESTAEVAAGLQSFPFALDSLGTVTAKTSNAPASLTIQQVLDIYEGRVTNWNQVGGTAGVIKPYIPQSGSGTLSFFTAQLTAAKGSTYNRAGSVTDFTENDDSLIRNDPNAIAPFSTGIAGIKGTLRVEGGFIAQRALYNVVRGTDVGNAGVLAAFGTNGYICSAAAKPLIEAAGFKQLFTPSKGGVCGQPTQGATSNFTVDNVPTQTAVTVTAASASSARVVARVSGSTAPNGTVTFFEGATAVASNVPLVSGAATATPSAAAGTHTYRAVFTPAANTAFLGSEGTGSGVVSKASSSLSESFPATAKVKVKVVKGKKKTTVKPVKGAVTVTLVGSSAKGSGTILVKKGAKTVGTGSLLGGVATFSLTGLKPGTNKLTATWGGDANSAGSTLSFSIKVAKAKKK